MSSSAPPFGASSDAWSEKEAHFTGSHQTGQNPNGAYLPYVPPPTGQPGNPARGSQGQTLAYSEIDANPLPQIVFGNELPEVVKSSPVVYPDAAQEDFLNHPIPVGDSGSGADGGVGGDPEKGNSAAGVLWYKTKSAIILAIICVIAIVAVFATLGGLGVFTRSLSSSFATSSGQSQSTSSTFSIAATSSTGVSSLSSTSTTASSATTSASSSTSTSATAIPTNLPQCTDYSLYIHNISLVTGNGVAHGLGWTLPKASSQEECCGICYNNTPTGCDLWVWSPKDNPTVPCTIIMGWNGTSADETCPYGHTDTESFTIQNGGTGILYNGPCGAGGTIVPKTGG